jgi:hypothetical protein
MRRPVRFVPIARDTLRRSPLAPPCNFKPQFLLGFKNYLCSALTLRGVSSLTVSLGDGPRVSTRITCLLHKAAREFG